MTRQPCVHTFSQRGMKFWRLLTNKENFTGMWMSSQLKPHEGHCLAAHQHLSWDISACQEQVVTAAERQPSKKVRYFWKSTSLLLKGILHLQPPSESRCELGQWMTRVEMWLWAWDIFTQNSRRNIEPNLRETQIPVVVLAHCLVLYYLPQGETRTVAGKTEKTKS